MNSPQLSLSFSPKNSVVMEHGTDLKPTRKLQRERFRRARQRRSLTVARIIRDRKTANQRNPNSRWGLKRKLTLPKKKTSIALPTVLDFTTQPKETASFFRHLRSIVGRGKYTEVMIDHTPLMEMSPAAALVLTAELYYVNKAQPRTLLVCKLPRDRNLYDLLGLIGYFRYFKGIKWTRPAGYSRFFLEHRRGEGVDRELARALVEHLRTVGKLPTAPFFEALIEGMQNAAEHGYGNRTTGYRSWWLLGYRDTQTGEIAYCFYDQGVGIPATIRPRLPDRIRSLFPSGSRLIRRAVQLGHYSRTGKPSRGRGLPTLHRFIESAARGELLIFAGESRCIFRSGQKPLLDDFSERLQGTLISWSFTA